MLVVTWAVACAMMSSFTLLPVVKVEDVSLMYVAHLRRQFQILTRL